MNSIGVIGGGSSGLITALILKKTFPKINVTVIKSNKIGIIGVGESTTEHIKEFVDFCEIDRKELIKETKAVPKLGILFKNWNKKDFIYSVPEELYNARIGQFNYGFADLIKKQKDSKEYTNKEMWNHKISLKYNIFQYNFNTFYFNEYLLKLCKRMKVKVIDDIIEKVSVNNNKISSLKGENKRYKFDFYIDATGFKKLLISNLKPEWISYKEYLPFNEAIAFPTEDTDKYPLYTIATKLKHGWMWNTPTQGRWGNGYVFNGSKVDKDKIKKECEKYLNKKIEKFFHFKFEPGALKESWIGNCVAIGLSSSFVEPLEATAISSGIQQTFLLSNLLINFDKNQVDQYNKTVENMNINIRDFISLHYITDTKWNLKIKTPETLKNQLKLWKKRLPIKLDFNSQYTLFVETHFFMILKELGMISKSNIVKMLDKHRAFNENYTNMFEEDFNINRDYYYKNSVDLKQYLQSF
jgi:tryptophan halogenase